MPKTGKRVFNFIGGLILTACCFFVAYMTFQNGWANLNEVDKFEGVITEKGITTYNGSILSNQAFYFKLKGFNQTLGVYNPNKDYRSLDISLNVGDTIKVFYNHSNLTDKLNLETFQIEKNNQNIFTSQNFQGRERIGFFITLISGLILLYLTFYQDKKIKHSK